MIPPAPPKWIGPRGLASITVGALAAAVSVALFGRETPLSGTGSSLVMFVAAAAATWRIASGPSLSGVPYKRALATGALYGPIAGLAAVAVHLASRPQPILFLELVLIGSVFGLIGGVVVVVVTLPLTVAARDWRVAPPVEHAFDRALGVDATALALLAVPCTALAAKLGDRGWDAAAASVLAAVGLGWFALRLWRRRRWLARVSAGAAAGFALEDATPDDAVLPVFLRATPGAKVLTQTATPVADGPFRAGPAAVTRVARVDPVRARRRLGLRAVLAVCVAGGVLAAQPPLAVMRAIQTNHTYLREPTKPTPVEGLDGVAVRDVAVARGYACAVLADASMRCWGNDSGTILVGHFRPTREPEAKAGLGHVGAAVLGDRRACILHEPGASPATCWGAGDFGELGVAGRAMLPPLDIGPREITQLALGDKFTLALTTDGKVHSWGVDPRHQVDEDHPLTYPLHAAVVEGIPAAQRVAAGREHACAIDRAGAVWCWGENGQGAVTGVFPDKDPDHVEPTRVVGLPSPVERLALGTKTTWARVRRADGHAEWWSWGARAVWGPNKLGGWVQDDVQPRVIPDTERIVELVVGGDHACGRAEDGSVLCWGPAGEMPYEAKTVLPPGSAEQLAGIESNHCARGKDRVWCWTWEGIWVH